AFAFAFAFAIVSSQPSPLPLPSSLRSLRLCLCHRLFTVFDFAFAIVSSPFSSSPLPYCRLRHRPSRKIRPKKGCSSADTPRRWRKFTVDRRPGIVLFCIIMFKLTRWLPPRLRPIFFVACRDRALFCPMAMGGTVAAPLGAVGNAPVGTSLCRRDDRFPGVCIPGMVSITVPARTCLRTSPLLFAILLT
ncbi:Uncharacterized protein APZ42_005925, partial [Daphnia magna]